jgi:hypothetical protein
MACYYYTVTVDDIDLLDATGNSNPAFNGVLFVDYTDCNGDPQTTSFSFAGVYTDIICVEESSFVSVYYYKNNSISIPSFSNATQSTSCSAPATPTPTPTFVPPTPTPTPTTAGTCWTIQIANGESPLFCDETNDGVLELYIKYTDNSGVFHNAIWSSLQYSLENPGYNTYHLCLQNSTSPSYAYGPSGLDQLLLCSLDESFGSCFDDSVCELPPASPTPTTKPFAGAYPIIGKSGTYSFLIFISSLFPADFVEKMSPMSF